MQWRDTRHTCWSAAAGRTFRQKMRTVAFGVLFPARISTRKAAAAPGDNRTNFAMDPFVCPHCRSTLILPDYYAGRKLGCPGCQGEIQILRHYPLIATGINGQGLTGLLWAIQTAKPGIEPKRTKKIRRTARMESCKVTWRPPGGGYAWLVRPRARSLPRAPLLARQPAQTYPRRCWLLSPQSIPAAAFARSSVLASRSCNGRGESRATSCVGPNARRVIFWAGSPSSSPCKWDKYRG